MQCPASSVRGVGRFRAAPGQVDRWLAMCRDEGVFGGPAESLFHNQVARSSDDPAVSAEALERAAEHNSPPRLTTRTERRVDDCSTNARTGVPCVEHHERIRADQCALRSTVERRYVVALWRGATCDATRSKLPPDRAQAGVPRSARDLSLCPASWRSFGGARFVCSGRLETDGAHSFIWWSVSHAEIASRSLDAFRSSIGKWPVLSMRTVVLSVVPVKLSR